MRSMVEGPTAAGASTIESSLNGSPPHQLRWQGGIHTSSSLRPAVSFRNSSETMTEMPVNTTAYHRPA